jgi:copper chaperone CopZ
MRYAVEQFLVPGVWCDQCVRAITKEVGAIQGVRLVVVNLEDKTVRVEHDGHVDITTLLRAIKQAGYDEVALLV